MIVLVRNWLLGITGAAIIASAADRLAPDGTVRKIGRLAGGLLLVIVILQPVLTLDTDEMSLILSEHRLQTEEYRMELETENIQLVKYIIEGKTAAYIQDKAEELGVVCSAIVTCRLSEDNIPYPVAVVITGDLCEEQIRTLSQLIEEELAIAAENQQYERTSAR